MELLHHNTQTLKFIPLRQKKIMRNLQKKKYLMLMIYNSNYLPNLN